MKPDLKLLKNDNASKNTDHPLTKEPTTAETYAQIDRLVGLSQQGSIDAREELVRRFTPLVRSLAYYYKKDIRDLEDACQDGYCKFLELLKNYDSAKMPPFNAHVKKMLTFYFMQRREKIWLNIKRLQTQSLENFDSEEKDYFDSVMDEAADYDHIYARCWREFILAKLPELIAELPERNRTAVTLVYLKKMTHRQAGLAVGIQEITMTMRVRKGIQLLRKRVDALAKEPFFVF